MKQKTLVFTLLGIFAVVIGGYAVMRSLSSTPRVAVPGELLAMPVTVYKSPTCGCCTLYASYLKRQGFSVTVQDVEDIGAIKDNYGVRPELESCHTATFGEKVVEGHVPVEAVSEMFKSESVDGVSLPGMPSGAPGMAGPKVSSFTIYELGEEAVPTTFMEL